MLDLRLHCNQLTGTIFPEMNGMAKLTALHLESNHLSGSLPSVVGTLTDLKMLLPGNNNLTNTIPSELGLLTNLSEVDWISGDRGLSLQNNQRQGRIPSELGMLSNLGRLWLQNNHLTGEIPLELQLLAMNNGSLMDLDVTGSAQLSGTILDEVCGMESLQFGCSSILCGCNYTCGA